MIALADPRMLQIITPDAQPVVPQAADNPPLPAPEFLEKLRVSKANGSKQHRRSKLSNGLPRHTTPSSRWPPHLAPKVASSSGCSRKSTATFTSLISTLAISSKETLDLRNEIALRYGIEVELTQPETTVAQYEAQHGGPLYKTNPINAASIAR